jgi:protein-tyrosine-phosphatase
MHRSTTKVLFVSEENGCRSLLAGASLNYLGKGKLRAFSCGVPGQVVDKPFSWTLLALKTPSIPTTNLRCKSWTKFTNLAAPKMDFVVALDHDSLTLHPGWHCQPMTALWDYERIEGGSKRRTDAGKSALQTLMSLRRRVELLVILHARAKTRKDLQHDLCDRSRV